MCSDPRSMTSPLSYQTYSYPNFLCYQESLFLHCCYNTDVFFRYTSMNYSEESLTVLLYPLWVTISQHPCWLLVERFPSQLELQYTTARQMLSVGGKKVECKVCCYNSALLMLVSLTMSPLRLTSTERYYIPLLCQRWCFWPSRLTIPIYLTFYKWTLDTQYSLSTATCSV